jgi:hypothetical protein
MKNLIIFILLTTFSFAQKQYKFDYSIQTEITFYKEDSIKKQVIYLTNSKDNSYFAELTSKDNLHYQMRFIHHDKIYSNVLVSKDGIKNADVINISCENVASNKNHAKNATKRYDFFILKDTIIDSDKHKVYNLKSILSKKKSIRRNAGTNLYIIDNSTSFHLPILTHPTAYEEWKLNKTLPNGLFIEKKHLYASEEEHNSEKLIGYTKINKKVIIPDKCNYLK